MAGNRGWAQFRQVSDGRQQEFGHSSDRVSTAGSRGWAQFRQGCELRQQGLGTVHAG